MTFDRKATAHGGVRQEGTTALAQIRPPEDLLRTMFRDVVQTAIASEFDRFMGAAPYERSEARTGWRNGYKPRTLKTRVGTIELRIPQDRSGQFSPSIFDRYQRSEKAFMFAMTEMYLQGISTRKVTKVVEELCGTSVSASEISLLTKKLDTELAAWRSRPLDGQAYPYLILDAHSEKVRREAHVRATAVLWAVGVAEDGYREHLGVWTGNSESQESWNAVFQDLTERGLSGVTYAVSDEHVGLVQGLRRYLPDAVHQRCQVHYLRNVIAHVSSDATRSLIVNALKDAWSAPTKQEAEARLTRVIGHVQKKLPKLAAWLEETSHETLGFYALKPEHRRRLRTTNSIEHDHAEVRRRTRVVRIFPNEASLIRLTTALAIERNEQWLERCYLPMNENQNDETKMLRQSA
jgi:putative transposase